MGSRSEDPNKLVPVTCKIPVHIRDKFAGIALLNGDIKVSRRMERLIMLDIEAVQHLSYKPFPSSRASAPVEDDPSNTFLEDEDPITLDSVQNSI